MLILNGTVVTTNGEGCALSQSGLRVHEGRITELGPSAELAAGHPGEELLDAQGMLVMPGLICAHAHPSGILARGMMLPGSIAVGEPLREVSRALDLALDYEGIRYAMLAYAIEALRGGVTTVFVHHSSPHALGYALDSLAEAVLQVGLRASLAYEVSDEFGVTNGLRGVEENARLARRVKNETHLSAMMGLGASMHLSDETLSAAVGAAAIADIGFHAHVAEQQADVQDCITRYGMRVVERLRKRGVLGRRTLAAHCVYIYPAEMDLLAKANAAVVHCARASLNDAAGLAPIPVCLEHSLSVGLGMDGFAGSLLGEMHVASLLLKHTSGYPHASTPVTVTRMALGTNAALASRIFRVRLGELAVGAEADIILVRYVSPTPITGQNLPWHLTMGLRGEHVDTVLVGGRVVMRHRTFRTIDEQAILAHAHEVTARLWQRQP